MYLDIFMYYYLFYYSGGVKFSELSDDQGNQFRIILLYCLKHVILFSYHIINKLLSFTFHCF